MKGSLEAKGIFHLKEVFVKVKGSLKVKGGISLQIFQLVNLSSDLLQIFANAGSIDFTQIFNTVAEIVSPVSAINLA